MPEQGAFSEGGHNDSGIRYTHSFPFQAKASLYNFSSSPWLLPGLPERTFDLIRNAVIPIASVAIGSILYTVSRVLLTYEGSFPLKSKAESTRIEAVRVAL